MATPLPSGVSPAPVTADPAVAPSPSQLLSPANLAAAARCMYTRIDSFTGEYKFLSLDYPSLLFFQGRFFPSARHALLAAKHPRAVEELASIEDIKELKQAAKNKEEDPDWARYRLKWMELIQRDKFRRNADLREKLRQTGGRELVWLNAADSFFGQTSLNRGQNHLGRILMEIRQNIQEETELESWLVICNDIETEERSLPVLRLLERKEGETTTTEILLRGKAFYRIGKLADNDLVALNPSVSRRHAALVILKGGHVLLIDLKSKAKTFKNGMPLDHDHVGVQMRTNDSFSLGASSRHYLLEVFVGGLAYSTSRFDICELFADIGDIKSVTIPQVDRSIPPDYEGAYCVRGIAFVEFADKEAAKKALGCAGRIVNGRNVSVTPANLTREERAAKEELMADAEMNFVAATEMTFDHPTHGSLRPGSDDDPQQQQQQQQRALLLSADPLTGEPLDRSGRGGHWQHDERETETRKQYTNAEMRQMQQLNRNREKEVIMGGGLRSEEEAAREARFAAAAAAMAAGNSNTPTSSSSSSSSSKKNASQWGSSAAGDKKERQKKRSRSRSHEKKHKSGRRRSRSR